jgi:putative ABC transport system permease protein
VIRLRVKDQLKLAFRAMTDRKLRTTLTIIGIVIGPATIVSLVAATQGYSAASTAQFDKLGATTMFVSPVGRTFSFTSSNVPQISDLSGVAAVVPYQELSGTITQGGQTVSVNIIGANLTELNEVFPSLSILNGSLPSSDSLNEAIIGYSIAYPDLSGATNLTVNQVLSVSDVRSGGGAGAIFFGPQGGGAAFFSSSSSSSSSTTTKSFLINGILSSFGQGLFIDPDTAVFIPITSSQTIEHTDTYSGVIVIASNINAVSTVSNELTVLFGNDVRVTTVSSILSTVQSVTSSTGTLLASVGSISVLVAFIAIMTTEFTSVMERTKEIGILKALGASARTILVNFISESLVVGLLGGLIGAAIGSALSFFIIGFLSGNSIPGLGRATGGARVAGPVSPSSTTTLHITPVITPELILLAVGLATLVGGLAGLLPAWRASRLTPVEALREA